MDRERSDYPVFRKEPASGSSVEDWCRSFFTGLIETKRLLFKPGLGLFRSLGGVPEHLKSVDEFRAALPSLYKISEWTFPGGPGKPAVHVPAIVRRDLAIHLFHSPFTSILPVLDSVIREPMVIRRNDKWEITPEGYDPLTCIFYYRDPLTTPFIPSATINHLTTCFRGVPFCDPGHRNNLLSWLVSGVMYDRQIEPPMLVISGNQPGIGKTKTMEACGYILTGTTQAPIEPEGAELEKQIGSRFAEGSRFIALDNVVTHNGASFKNHRLARLLTEGHSKRVRLLGVSRSIAQKGVLFVITANDCKLSADLATRSLLIKLYSETCGLMDPYVVDYAVKYRTEIYNELLGLALSSPSDLSSPGNDFYPHFRFRSWLAIARSTIVKQLGPLIIDQASELDDAIIDLYSWGYDQMSGDGVLRSPDFDSTSLSELLKNHAAQYSDLVERFGTAVSDRVRKTRITKFLTSLVDKPFTTSSFALMLRQTEKGDHNKPPRFCFERISA